MRRFLVFVFLTLFITPATAAPFKPWNPPARFDHAYSGRITYIYGKRNYPWRCWNAYACTYSNYPTANRCTMYMPNRDEVIAGVRFDLASWKALFRHERGHCNGWPGNHPA